MKTIDTSKPSRELNIEIHLWIFGKVWPNGAEMLPDYSGRLGAAYAMEAEIERRGLHLEYIRHLASVAEIVNYASMGQRYWLLAHATPLQRCAAALRAVESEVRP